MNKEISDRELDELSREYVAFFNNYEFSEYYHDGLEADGTILGGNKKCV